MASNALSVEAKLDDGNVVSKAKSMRQALEGCEAAAGGLDGKTAALSVTLGTLASQAISGVLAKGQQLAQQVIEIGSGFESSMSKVSALSGATGDDLAALEAKARELGASTTFSASQAADALGYMALAGWDTQQMLDGVGGALTLAQAGEMDLAAASDLVTDYLSAFNMTADETSRMVDVLAYAQANANTTVEGLGMAFKNCAANCNAAGMDVETTSAAIAMMANQGLKGQEAGTALNAVMRDMTARMTDGAIAIGDASVKVMDAEGNYRDFVDILADVEAATNGMGEAEKAAALQSTFTADSIKGLNLLLNAGASEAAAFREDLYGCAGAAEQTAATMTDNLGGDLAAMQSALEELAIKVYQGLQEPLRDGVQFITSTVVPGIEALVRNIDKVAPALVGIGAGFLVLSKGQKVLDLLKEAQEGFAKALDTSAVSHTRLTVKQTANGTMLTKFNTLTKQATILQNQSAASVRLHTAAVKASEVAMKLGTVAARTMSTALKTIAPIAAMTALVEVVTLVGGAMGEASEHAALMEKATHGVSNAMGEFDRAASQAAGTMDDAAASSDGLSESLGGSARSIQDCLEATASLADKMGETWSEYGTNAGLVDAYAQTIADLAGKEKLTADEQARLQTSVEAFNELTGESVSIINAQTGELNKSADAILKTAEAYKEEARAEAARELMKENAKELVQNELALKQAKQELAQAQAALNDETDPYAMQAYTAQIAEQQGKVDELTSVIESQNQAQSDLIGVISQTPASFDSLTAALESCGLSMASFAGASEEQLSALQAGFDGSLASIVSTCASQGLQIPSALASSIQASMGLPESAQQAMFDAMVLKATGGDVEAAMQVLGHDIDQGLMDGITGSAEMPAEAIGYLSEDVIARAKEHFDSHSPSLVMTQLGNDIDQGLTDGINGGAAGPASAMTALGATALAGIQGLPGQASGFGASAGLGLASGIGGAVGQVSGAAASLSASAMSGVQTSKASFEQAGAAAVQGFGEPIGRADMYDKARALGVTAEKGLGSVRGNEAGVQFAQGYGLGMEGQGNFVYQKAYALAQQAVNGVKDAQRSASPSKVARGLGGDYGQGYGLGIEGQQAFARQAGVALVSSATDGASSIGWPTFGLDWNSTAGRYNSMALLGLAAPSVEASVAPQEQSGASDETMREVLEELRALHRDLPRILEACLKVTLSISEREFGRLVHEAEGWY